jgi:hypothetical protein
MGVLSQIQEDFHPLNYCALLVQKMNVKFCSPAAHSRHSSETFSEFTDDTNKNGFRNWKEFLTEA